MQAFMARIDYVCEKVNKVIKKYDTRNPFEICSDMNIHIHYKDLGTALKAYYFYQSRIKNIVSIHVPAKLCGVFCAGTGWDTLYRTESLRQ